MMKAPSMQFYPGDWLKDPAVRASSRAARGLWIDMLCLMFESGNRGYLETANGNPITITQLARMTGASVPDTKKDLDELEENGVLSRDDRGVVFCRRMVRDEKLRQVRSQCGSLGGNPRLVGRELKQSGKQIPTPSSSSSSSSSDKPFPSSEELRKLCGGKEPIEWFEELFTGEWLSETWRVFGAELNTPDLMLAFLENVPQWMKTRKWREGYGTNSIKFIKSGVWKKPPNPSMMAKEDAQVDSGQPPAHAIL